MIKLQPRDLEIIEALNQLKVISSSQMQRLFFNGCQQSQSRRCKKLVNHKVIKSFRPGVWQENVYYIKRKPTQQLKSMLLVTELYVQLVEYGVHVLDFTREYCIPDTDIRCDAHFLFESEGYNYEVIVEIDLTHCNTWKYEKYLVENYIFPPLITVSPFKRQYSEKLEHYHIKVDFSNLKDIIQIFK